MESRYNLRSPAVKRLMKEAQELRHATEEYFAQPLEDNLFEWHFTVRGPSESEFDGGLYHGRIILPPEYPMKPPSIILLTPNGRFETNKKICLSISGHHPESWQPSWSIRTALLAIIGFMPTHGNGAIGSLDYTADERKQLALKSQSWSCPVCGSISGVLADRTSDSNNSKDVQEARELATQISLKAQKENGREAMVMQQETAEIGLRLRTLAGSFSQPGPTVPLIEPPPASSSEEVPAAAPEPSTSPSHHRFTLLVSSISFFLFFLIVRRLFFL